MTELKEKRHVFYCDGSCIGNPGPGGWGWIYVGKNGVETEHGSGREKLTTNNQMELTAMIRAIEASIMLYKETAKFEFRSDSSYVIRGINEWSSGWERKKFKDVKNPELWKRLLSLIDREKMTFVWVKGHCKDPYNDRVDQLAKGLDT